MKKIIVLLLFVSSFGFSQNLNNYKYALVPAKFTFLKEKDQFRLNTLTKMLMEKYGFETYFDSDILPTDFAKENCNKVFVDVEENNSMMVAKLRVVLKDCKNNILFISEEGKSKEKEYKIAYNQALREAFNSFNNLHHKYVEKIDTESQVVVKTNSIEDATPQKTEEIVGETTAEGLRNSLSVVTTENGFDLYSIESKLLYSAKRTSLKNVYIATCGVEKGILKKDYNDTWYFEYYREGSKKLMSEPLSFKF